MFKLSHPFLLFPELWKEFGTNGAIVLAQLDYWIEHNRANGTGFHEGRYWTYNSIKAWKEQFLGWSENTIKRTLAGLEKDGLVLSDNFNKSAYDRTKWYTIIYENPRFAPFVQFGRMENISVAQPIPETNREAREKRHSRTKLYFARMTPSERKAHELARREAEMEKAVFEMPCWDKTGEKES